MLREKFARNPSAFSVLSPESYDAACAVVRVGPRMNILIVETCGLGDFVATLPTIVALQARGASSITVAIRAEFAGFAKALPYVSHTIPLGLKGLRSGLAALRHVRAQRYDAAINFHPSRFNTLITFGSKAKLRLGYLNIVRRSLPSLQSNLLVSLGTRIPSACRIPPGTTLYDRAARILDFFPIAGSAPRYIDYIPPASSGSRETQLFLEKLDVVPQDYFVLHPFSSRTTKNWPVEHCAAFVDSIWLRYKFKTIIIGDPGDSTKAGLIVRQCKSGACHFVSPPLSLLTGLVASACCFVGVDSGPLHIAVGMAIRTIGLFGRTAPDLIFPREILEGKLESLYSNHSCTCGYDSCVEQNRCMRLVSPDQVAAKVDLLLNR